MTRRRALGLLLVLVAVVGAATAPPAVSASKAELDRDAARVLKNLYARNATAGMLGRKAKGVLVFPNMVKAGFMFGGQIGEGALFQHGQPVAYYNSVAASYGFQAGVQAFGYALFFMNDSALSYLDRSGGWEVGVGPSIVVVSEGAGKSMTSTTATQDVYAFVFDQKGLMAGVGVQGSKITRISK